MKKLIYENKVTSAFKSKVIRICGDLGVDPNWLMAIMYNESRLNPKATNKIGATGLIQFTKPTARYLGTSTTALRSMTALQQLDYVKKYYAKAGNRIKSYTDMYLWTFFPIAVGKSADFVLQSRKYSASKIAIQNPAFDTNKDNKLTKLEVEKVMISKIPLTWRYYFQSQASDEYKEASLSFKATNTVVKNKKTVAYAGAGVLAVAGAMLLLGSKKKKTNTKSTKTTKAKAKK